MHTTTHIQTRRTAIVLLFALLLAVVAAAPALAESPAAPTGPGALAHPTDSPDPDPTGPGDIAQPTEAPDPDPTGPDDLAQPTEDPTPTHPDEWKNPDGEDTDPEPTVAISVAPHCEPDAGIHYVISVEDEPNGPTAFKAQWRGDDGVIHTVDGQTGSITTGEGTIEVRGVMHIAGPGFYATDFVEVDVDCDTDGGGSGTGGSVGPVDPPLPGLPTFTG